jgi:uridine kinase
MAHRIARRLKVVAWNTTHGSIPIAAITGDGAIGKSVLAQAVAEQVQRACIISTDSFLLDREQRRLRGNLTGDDPRSINIEDLVDKVTIISRREGVVSCKRYDHSTGYLLTGDRILAEQIGILLIEGAFATHPSIRNLLSFTIFLDAAYTVRRELRRIVDTSERGYSLTEFEQNWPTYESAYQEYVKPNATPADMIVKVTHERLFITPENDECICEGMNYSARRR